MRKDLEKRLLAVAALLDRTTALQKIARGDKDNGFWKKFFYKEPTVAPKGDEIDHGMPKQDPKTMVAPEAPAQKAQPAPGAKVPQPAAQPGAAPLNAIKEFLTGGPVPLEVVNPLAQLAKSLAGSGAIGENDVKSVVAFLAKMLRKYVGGQQLTAEAATSSPVVASTAAEARKARIAAREVDADISDRHLVHTDGGCYELQAGGNPENYASWERASGPLSGLYRGNVKIDDVPCVMFADAQGNTYAAPRQDVRIDEPIYEASAKDQVTVTIASRMIIADGDAGLDAVKTLLSRTTEQNRPFVMQAMLRMLETHGTSWDKLGPKTRALFSPYVGDRSKNAASSLTDLQRQRLVG
jgi:hypothetical protein